MLNFPSDQTISFRIINESRWYTSSNCCDDCGPQFMHALMETGCTWYTSSKKKLTTAVSGSALSCYLDTVRSNGTAHPPRPTAASKLKAVVAALSHIQQSALIAAFKPPFRWLHEFAWPPQQLLLVYHPLNAASGIHNRLVTHNPLFVFSKTA